MKKLFTLITAVVLTSQLSFGQIELSPTVIASAGNYAEAGSISLSWTLGEIAVSTLEQGDLILTQGFQQSYLDKDNNIDLDPIDWQIVAYPNPVDNELKIQFNVLEPTDFWVEIQDVTGRILSQKQFKEIHPGDIIPVSMSSYKYGVYFFRVFTPDRQQMRVISIRKI
jgi:hypothetical protein